MRSIRARFTPVADGDRGMTLIEVLVAMFVFAIISTLVLSSLVQITTLTQQSRAQHVAANLAAGEIDFAHDTPDLFTLLNDTRDVTVNGTIFHVRRETAWVGDTSSTVSCGGGNLRFKRVHVTVTWDGMRASAEPVRADTLISPTERINDPSKGTVLVSIIDSIGEGVGGATVSLTATSGGASIPNVTSDAQGCAYFLQVPKGTYDVTIAKSGYTGVLQETPLQRDVSVQAGSSTTVGLQYDLAARLDLTFAPGSSARMPSSMPLTLLSTYGVRTYTLPTTAARQTVGAHPRVSYRVVAGEFQQANGDECDALDPTAWTEGIVGVENLAPGVATEISGEPGATVTADVPMGIVRVPLAIVTLRATARTGRPDDPTCDASIQLEYKNVPLGGVIAVPYGTWEFTAIGLPVSVTPLSRGANLSGNVVTLDPREVAP
ncbi:carboxypeptidase regulatory-like domain-containing protein [Agrococcus sp. ProA11]|uniref:carboxypeptidase regulatory-like domain-containing protein n=1 Tax=Agrococcus chionoecetis TaxID=3153752 RepID=UPI003260EEF4